MCFKSKESFEEIVTDKESSTHVDLVNASNNDIGQDGVDGGNAENN